MIIINTQLTFENFYACSTLNIRDNVLKFPSKNTVNSDLFTSQGKRKARTADSIKTLEEIEKIKDYFIQKNEKTK